MMMCPDISLTRRTSSSFVCCVVDFQPEKATLKTWCFYHLVTEISQRGQTSTLVSGFIQAFMWDLVSLAENTSLSLLFQIEYHAQIILLVVELVIERCMCTTYIAVKLRIVCCVYGSF